MNIATPLTAVKGLADSSLVDLVDEVIRRVQAGEAIDPDALAGDDPQRAEQIRQLLPTLEKLADLGGSATSDHTGGPPASSDAGPGVGTLGDFHLLREVGRGGMGIVYEARQLSLHRRVALKVLPFAAVTDPKQLQRFHVEAQAAAQLHHTNIVPVFAVGCERGVHYYAMQFIEGETLARVIEELRQIDGPRAEAASPAKDLAFALASGLASGPLDATEPGPDAGPRTASAAAAAPLPAPSAPPRTPVPSSGSSTRSRAFFQNAARLGIQAAEALEHAHQQGVLHRDIKPSNLLVDARGNLWITDFGLARLAERGQPDPDRRHPGHAAVHEPRAGDGQAGRHRPPHRRLLAGGHALRVVDAAPGLRGERPAGAAAADRLRGAAAVAEAERGDAAGAGDDRAEGAGRRTRRVASPRRRSWPTTCGGSWRTGRSRRNGRPWGSGRPSGRGGTRRWSIRRLCSSCWRSSACRPASS